MPCLFLPLFPSLISSVSTIAGRCAAGRPFSPTLFVSVWLEVFFFRC
jgi:hypothetical protein